MAKRRRRQKQKKRSSTSQTVEGRKDTRAGRIRLTNSVLGVGAVVLVAVLGLVGWLVFAEGSVPAGVDGADDRNQTALAQVEEFPCESLEHVQPGIHIEYPTDPPVCGPHYPQAVAPGFYATEETPAALVHSLEHGHVVIYYDQPASKALQTLQSWAARFTGEWDGVIVAPRPGLGAGVILTAWGKMLRLETFDEQAAMAFLDAYRGRGPEHPVR